MSQDQRQVYDVRKTTDIYANAKWLLSKQTKQKVRRPKKCECMVFGRRRTATLTPNGCYGNMRRNKEGHLVDMKASVSGHAVQGVHTCEEE